MCVWCMPLRFDSSFIVVVGHLWSENADGDLKTCFKSNMLLNRFNFMQETYNFGYVTLKTFGFNKFQNEYKPFSAKFKNKIRFQNHT